MTNSILKSTLSNPDAFPILVQQQCDELASWHEHMQKVAAQGPLAPKPEWSSYINSENPALDFQKAMAAWNEQRLKHYDPIPRPIIHPFLNDSIKEVVEEGVTKFVPDFVIIDDTEPDAPKTHLDEEQTLRDKKNQLLTKVMDFENAALERVDLPPGKRRLASIKEKDALDDDNARRTQFTRALLRKVKPDEPVDLTAVEDEVKATRPEHHRKHLEEQDTRRKRMDVIHRKAAEVMAEIEDLTSENIDSYTLPVIK